MKANRTITREKAMTVLYQILLYKKNNINYVIEDVINEMMESLELEDRKKIDLEFLSILVSGVLDNINDIDNSISKYLENWSIDRLGLTDQAIIRIGTYELVYTNTPNLVCINEAIELAKKYSDDKVVKMIEEYLVQVETAEKPETVPVPEPVVTLKTIERPKEEAKVKQDTLLGKIDAFFGRNLSTPHIIDEKNDIKMKLKL